MTRIRARIYRGCMNSSRHSSICRLRTVATWGWSVACLLALLPWAPAAAQIYDIEIVGTWEWVSTQIEGQAPTTPETAGYTEQWEFTVALDFYKYQDRHRQQQARFGMSEVLTDEFWTLTLSIIGGDSFMIEQLDQLVLVLLGNLGRPPRAHDLPAARAHPRRDLVGLRAQSRERALNGADPSGPPSGWFRSSASLPGRRRPPRRRTSRTHNDSGLPARSRNRRSGSPARRRPHRPSVRSRSVR